MNDAFIDKIEKQKNNIPQTQQDPLEFTRHWTMDRGLHNGNVHMMWIVDSVTDN